MSSSRLTWRGRRDATPARTACHHGASRPRQSAAFLRPELFARITEKLVFARLSYDVQMEIAEAMLAGELAFLAEKGLALSCAPAVLPFLVQRGFHPRLGARPMRDAVEKHVRDAVSRALLADSEIVSAALIVKDGSVQLHLRRLRMTSIVSSRRESVGAGRI